MDGNTLWEVFLSGYIPHQIHVETRLSLRFCIHWFWPEQAEFYAATVRPIYRVSAPKLNVVNLVSQHSIGRKQVLCRAIGQNRTLLGRWLLKFFIDCFARRNQVHHIGHSLH